MYQKMLTVTKDLLLDGLFPPTCQGCGSDESWLCRTCLGVLPLTAEDQPDPPLGSKAFVALGLYAQPIWRTILMSLKYQSASCLQDACEKLLKRVRRDRRAPWPWAEEQTLVVAHIPGDPKRVHTRGFDHAKFLANCVRRVLVPWADMAPLLQRQRSTHSNASLPTDERRALNIHGAFVCIAPLSTPVILVDDVYTTGATLKEGIRALRAAGCPRVYVVTMARSLLTHQT